MGKVLVINNADFSKVAVKKVKFLKGSYIKITPNFKGADSLVSGEGFYAIGETATLSVASNDMYSFVKWSDGIATPTRTITVTNEGNLTLYAEYELIGGNNFIWGNGGILNSAGRSSGLLNEAASSVKKFIHTLSECTFIINPDYVEDFIIGSIAYSKEKPIYEHPWNNFRGFIYMEGLREESYTIPSDRYMQISIKNKNSVPFTADLSICADILGCDGDLELVD